MEDITRTYAAVDLGAIEQNMENMHKNLTPDTKMLAVIKSNGYGHGAEQIAKRLEPKDYVWGFAVATADEAFSLRGVGIGKPILILGYSFPKDYPEMIRRQIRPAVFTLAMARELSDTALRLGMKCPVHFAVDTGMTRIGFRRPGEAAGDMLAAAKLPGLSLEGMFTHFARADEKLPEEPTGRQMEEFLRFVRLLEENGVHVPILHINNSAGILWNRAGDFQMVRPGITIYGVAPSDECRMGDVELNPALSWKASITHIKEVEAGVPVSYGGTFVTTRPMTRIATIPVGYADGYPRSLSNRGYVLIGGRRAPILGRVCMDQFMVDVTDIPEARVHGEVTLLGTDHGETISAGTLGALSGRFPYELLCMISARVPRIYRG